MSSQIVVKKKFTFKLKKKINIPNVVNVKVKYLRSSTPYYDNLKEWIADCNNEYVGRRGILIINSRRYPEESSIWCNPYKSPKNGTLDEILIMYEKYIRDKIKNDEIKIEQLINLGKNKQIGCWCVENETIYNESNKIVCHAQILQKLIKEYSK
jgi:hypothetical protein